MVAVDISPAMLAVLRERVAAAGFTIVTADFEGSIYGAYTCIRA